jgi:hypothetical protein
VGDSVAGTEVLVAVGTKTFVGVAVWVGVRVGDTVLVAVGTKTFVGVADCVGV